MMVDRLSIFHITQHICKIPNFINVWLGPLYCQMTTVVLTAWQCPVYQICLLYCMVLKLAYFSNFDISFIVVITYQTFSKSQLSFSTLVPDRRSSAFWSIEERYEEDISSCCDFSGRCWSHPQHSFCLCTWTAPPVHIHSTAHVPM